jgi:hypothetical protein
MEVEGPMRTRVLAFAVALAGCATYDSTYWRHPITGVTVECEASWNDGMTWYNISAHLRTRCGQLMKRAGLLPISHDEGKQWEKTGSRVLERGQS